MKQLEKFDVVEKADGSFSEAPLTISQTQIVIKNCKLLQMHVVRALEDDYYPIVLGGDDCQTIGSVKAL